jgi:DAK2 domain fusion protein YloV
MVSPIDGQVFKISIEAALTWLKTNQQLVNSLNVFPVPDGDTGTNMVLTMQSAYNEIATSGERNFGKMAHALAKGALMGARGNSGVILSQLWRGFARELDSQETITPEDIVRGLREARNTAYKGVVKPVEGTILTVATDIVKRAEEVTGQPCDTLTLLEAVVEAADQSVKHTPELLPILKTAGVVDSGGKGLFIILEGMLRHIQNLSLETPLVSVQPISAMNLENAQDAVEPGQDYEVVIDFQPSDPLNLDLFYNQLSDMGSSIQVGEGDGFYRMHIHVPTENLYSPIDYTKTIGIVKKVAIENLMDQVSGNQKKADKIKLEPIEPGQIAVVAVSPGLGISRILASLGVAAIVEGGQTMNPSTEEILAAFENLPTEKVIILPNNKNIRLASQSAADVTTKKVAVINSKNIPQGLSALLHLDPDGDFDKVVEAMERALTDVESGEITTATRTVELNGVSVNKGEVIALHNGQLVYSAENLEEACLGFLAIAKAAEHERITLFYGADISRNEVNRIVDKIRGVYKDQEVELHDGGQPHYQFIISLE